VAVVGLILFGMLRASLPELDGERRVAGLGAAVRVERDALGVPTVHGQDRLDVARATGFLHAQDRFFQMDLLRRKAAGELAELVGPAGLSLDRRARVHRFRNVAERGFQKASPELRALVVAYTAGVNAGLEALRARPFEYLVLRSRPLPWRPEDTVLVTLAMFMELQDDAGQLESTLGVMRDTLPAPLFAFLAPLGTEWDAPLVGDPVPAVPMPGPEVVDLRSRGAAPPRSSGLFLSEPFAAGSNNWAIAGKISSHGGALLADDMHLGLSLPNTWYRMSLQWPGHRVTGVTLPGTPAVVVGSTGHVAWGFTNSEGDWVDLIELEMDPKDPDRYATPEGPRHFSHVREHIHVKGGADEVLEVLLTVWGPVVDHDHTGRPRALRWVAHEPRALSMGLLKLEDAQNLDEALAIAAGAGTPEQNFVCVDSAGRIGWTIAGAIPRRVGFDGRTPASWADGSRRWDGWLAEADYPRIVDPPEGRLWTANARVVEGEALAKIGYGGYELGARARQIRDDLRSFPLANEKHMLRIQLDDGALFLNRWRNLLTRTLQPLPTGAVETARAWARGQAVDWPGEASVRSISYRMVRAFRLAVMEEVLSPLFEPCRKVDPQFDAGRLHQSEAPLWRLISERPAHLLNPRYHSWDELLLGAVDKAVASLGRDQGGDGSWGEHNTVAIRHPLSRALPWLSRLLDIPAERLPGDINMPRVQTPTHGASERLVVSPGHEESGLFQMPGGQSGHPLSPFYRAGHEAWAHGVPTPFLPGATLHTLTLQP
jgi:penicillin amidase